MALYVDDFPLLRKLSIKSNETLSISDRGSEISPSVQSDDSNYVSNICKVHSGYMIMYKVSSNLLRQRRRKPVWASLTQGKKLVLSKRGKHGKYKGIPKIFDLCMYDKCEFVGESKELITIYSTDRDSDVDSLLLVAPSVEEAQEWVDLISYNLNVEHREEDRGESQDAEGFQIATPRITVCA